MSVYVDSMAAPLGRMIMCHMVADSSDELHEMAAKIGVLRKWCQDEGTHREHYDICKSKRARAVQNKAIEITRHQLAEILKARRATHEAKP